MLTRCNRFGILLIYHRYTAYIPKVYGQYTEWNDGSLCPFVIPEESFHGIEGDVLHPLLVFVGSHGYADSLCGIELLAEQTETLCTDIVLGLHLDGYGGAMCLHKEIHFGRASLVGPISHIVELMGMELLHDVLFGESTFELCKQGVAPEERVLVETCHGGKQSDIEEEELKHRQFLIGN